MEQAYAIFANVIEFDEQGSPINAKYAEYRAAQYIRSYCDQHYKVVPPFDVWNKSYMTQLQNSTFSSHGRLQVRSSEMAKICLGLFFALTAFASASAATLSESRALLTALDKDKKALLKFKWVDGHAG